MVGVEDVVEVVMDGGVEGIDGNLKQLVAQSLSVGTINVNGAKNIMYICVDPQLLFRSNTLLITKRVVPG